MGLVMSENFVRVFTLASLYFRVYSIWDSGILAQIWGIYSKMETPVYFGLIYLLCEMLKHQVSDALTVEIYRDQGQYLGCCG